MRPVRLLAPALLCVLLALTPSAFAGDYGPQSLIGTWEFDLVKAMRAQMEAAGQEVPPQAEAMLEGSYMRIRFVDGGEYRFDAKMPMGEQKEFGTWEVTASEGPTLTLKTVGQAEGEEQNEQTVVITFTGEDSFSAAMSAQGQQVVMEAKRVQPKEDGDEPEDESQG
ncbi:MAG: hypothetical protein ACYTG6_16490 [Planctomycetota bacterium]|jgi:hypothetical protein